VATSKNLSGLFDITNHLSYVGDNNNITNIIDLVIKREYSLFLNTIYSYKYKSLFDK
jgi:hypothetical protein